MPQMTVALTFFSRRQNTNKGDDQYRLWVKRADVDEIATLIPELRSALLNGSKWSNKVQVSWRNGEGSKRMSFGAYKKRRGEMSFTAEVGTKLFSFAEHRHEGKEEDDPIAGSCLIENGSIRRVVLDVTL